MTAAPPAITGNGPGKKRRWIANMFTVTRALVILAITGLFIAAVIVITYGFAELYRIVMHVGGSGLLSEGAGKYLAVNMTEMIDLNLIGIVLVIIAIGLFQLFIKPDLSLPKWLDTPSLDALKERLLVVIVVLLPVIFLGFAATWSGGVDIAALGFGIALVMIATGYILSIVGRFKGETKGQD
ncbi:YqhA family protein [Methanoregula sp.]|uniref:YqhA family protein n=1 Tax=Methanoregula sp. TaxID=2052170 RepID=UPI002B6ACBF4|nr:YqhA family protein [Methanoregula sp.]HVP96508.1 YqhA family protein [Methanoregula sp.]